MLDPKCALCAPQVHGLSWGTRRTQDCTGMFVFFSAGSGSGSVHKGGHNNTYTHGHGQGMNYTTGHTHGHGHGYGRGHGNGHGQGNTWFQWQDHLGECWGQPHTWGLAHVCVCVHVCECVCACVWECVWSRTCVWSTCCVQYSHWLFCSAIRSTLLKLVRDPWCNVLILYCFFFSRASASPHLPKHNCVPVPRDALHSVPRTACIPWGARHPGEW